MKFKLQNTTVFEKIINILLDILIFIFGVILLIFIYNGVQIKILHNDYSSFFGYSIFEVETGSMADEINPGDWIIIKSKTNYELNDIVTYKQNGEFITHRIIEAYADTYITKGDANTSKDDPINKNQVVGKTVKVLSYFGVLRKTLFNPAVLLSVIITLYLAGFALKKNDKNVKKKIIKPKLKKVEHENNIESNKIVQPIAVKIEDKSESVTDNISTDKISENLDNLNIKNYDEDELNKTMCFRMIQVDADDLNSSKIIMVDETEVTKSDEIKSNKKVEKEDDEEVIFDGNEILDKAIRHRKSKNLIDKVISIKEDNISDIVSILKKNEKIYSNEATIKDYFISLYIDAKYYNNYLGHKSAIKLDKYINDISKTIISDYSGKDDKYSEKVNKYKDIFSNISKIENVDNDTSKKEICDNYFNILQDYFKSKGFDGDECKYICDQIYSAQKKYDDQINDVLENLNTNTFDLTYNKFISKKNLYALELKHNINFSKIYSDYIVEKVYTEGVIAEDKIIILLTLLQIQLIKNMMKSDFNTQYILNLPSTLYSKEVKFNRLLKMIDDDYAKRSILILITYEDLINNKTKVTKLRQQGYSFALVFDKSINMKTKNKSCICLCEYVFIDKDSIDISNIVPYIPKDLSNSIIYEDVIDMVGGE